MEKFLIVIAWIGWAFLVWRFTSDIASPKRWLILVLLIAFPAGILVMKKNPGSKSK